MLMDTFYDTPCVVRRRQAEYAVCAPIIGGYTIRQKAEWMHKPFGIFTNANSDFYRNFFYSSPYPIALS